MSGVAAGGTEPQKVELILAQLDSLPMLAPVATRILSLTEDSQANAKEIVKLIESDPSLTVRVLSALGRAEHGVRREAVTVANATLMLGFGAIRQLTLAFKVMEVFGAASEATDSAAFDRLEFWKHCLAVACAARRIAMVVPGAPPHEEVFVLGLLHDIGKDALNAAVPKSFARILGKAAETRSDIVDVERAVLGLDHTEVGHRLAERWGLPERLVECVWLHHHPPEALPASVAAGKHVQIVQLADTLVREHRIGCSGNDHVAIPSGDLAGRLGLDESARRGIVESLVEEIEERATWIGAEEIDSREVYLRALMRSTEELTSANAALGEHNRRLERKAEYFAALGWINQSVSPKASVREVCGAGADVFRRVLSVSALLVFVGDRGGRWVEIGFSEGTAGSEILERPEGAADESADMAMAVSSAAAGTWIAPPGRSFDAVVDRYRGRLGEGPVWLLPLVREQQWVGGALFSCDGETAAGLRSESAEIEALSSALGLAIAQAQSRASAIALNDELAAAGRRMSTLQGELLRAKTLESVVAMAAGAAHELNNPLAVISARGQMLRGRVEGEEAGALVEAVIEQAHACSDIVTELMDFAQSRRPQPEKIDVQEFLEALKAQMVSAELLDGSALSVEVASDTPPVRFDRRQFGRMFRELLQNAIDATEPASRRLTVKAAGDLTEESVVLVVSDNGRGMTAEVLNRAVDPFFSDRPAGRGRGLGLARVNRWMQDNGGTMKIESQAGRGTSVELRLLIDGGRTG